MKQALLDRVNWNTFGEINSAKYHWHMVSPFHIGIVVFNVDTYVFKYCSAICCWVEMLTPLPPSTPHHKWSDLKISNMWWPLKKHRLSMSGTYHKYVLGWIKLCIICMCLWREQVILLTNQYSNRWLGNFLRKQMDAFLYSPVPW